MAATLTTIYADKSKAFKWGGSDTLDLMAIVPIASGAEVGSIYRLFQVPSSYVPFQGWLNTTAITDATDADLGLYLTAEDGGTVKEVDIFLNGQSLAVAKDTGSEVSALTGLGYANLGSNLATLADDYVNEYAVYDVALTLNAQPSTSGTVVVRMSFVYGA